jgi:dihydrofolate reductase
MVTIIAAVTLNNAIGYKNSILTKDPLDMLFFKTMTENNTVIMGRKTRDSLFKGFLPNRNNIVVSSTSVPCDFSNNVFHTASLESAIAASQYLGDEDVFIIGGETIYRQALEANVADRMILTRHWYTPKAWDTIFPDIPDNWKLVRTIPYYAIVNTKYIYTEIEIYERTT